MAVGSSYPNVTFSGLNVAGPAPVITNVYPSRPIPHLDAQSMPYDAEADSMTVFIAATSQSPNPFSGTSPFGPEDESKSGDSSLTVRQFYFGCGTPGTGALVDAYPMACNVFVSASCLINSTPKTLTANASFTPSSKMAPFDLEPTNIQAVPPGQGAGKSEDGSEGYLASHGPTCFNYTITAKRVDNSTLPVALFLDTFSELRLVQRIQAGGVNIYDRSQTMNIDNYACAVMFNDSLQSRSYARYCASC
ncbi:hypothetical protein MRB53_038786 [Persea americana]|nr:hypothetical protein MRB53_038786 [Persea americana]